MLSCQNKADYIYKMRWGLCEHWQFADKCFNKPINLFRDIYWKLSINSMNGEKLTFFINYLQIYCNRLAGHAENFQPLVLSSLFFICRYYAWAIVASLNPIFLLITRYLKYPIFKDYKNCLKIAVMLLFCLISFNLAHFNWKLFDRNQNLKGNVVYYMQKF